MHRRETIIGLRHAMVAFNFGKFMVYNSRSLANAMFVMWRNLSFALGFDKKLGSHKLPRMSFLCCQGAARLKRKLNHIR